MRGRARRSQAVGVLDVTKDALGLLDLEPWELGKDVFRRVEDTRVARPADALGQVREVVADQHERATGRECGLSAGEHKLSFGARELKKEDEHEVERSRLGLVVEEVRVAEVDVDSFPRNARLPFRDRHFGKVDSGDAPAELCEPDGMSTLAAREIERSARR